ncbi:MAG: hypothetical protein MI921_24595 [Cytophagales bacterium]|nr:hypothetical protein [Cytophagales bacterium]
MMVALKLTYAANLLVAGWIGIYSLFLPKTAIITVFSNAYEPTEVVRLVGCLWLAIALLSAFGLWKPMIFSPVLFIQLIYKGGWLLFVATPAIVKGESFPRGMAVFFVIWVAVLPFVIPWKDWF